MKTINKKGREGIIMKYIDWYYEKCENKLVIYEERDDNYLYWEDLVTETHYCISKGDYGRIYTAGKEKLRQYLAEEGLEAVEKVENLFYHPTQEEGEVGLFSSLPYIIENKNKCARICDYVCFRTACLYALKYENIKKSPDIEEEKRKLRMLGLTSGIVNNSIENAELEQIERMLRGERIEDKSFVNHKADLVKGGMIKIKKYYLETNKIPEIRGASLLLDRINSEMMEKEIKQMHIKECLIYAGGGKMMGIFPEGCGKDICQSMELLVEKETVTAQSNFYSQSYEMKRLMNDYKGIIKEMDLALEERQGIRWDFRIEPHVPEKKLEEKPFSKLNKSNTELCDSCRNRYAVAEWLKEPKAKLCQSCLYKRLAGGRNAKDSMLEKYKKYVKEKHNEKILGDSKDYNKLEEIAENGFIGVIYGDANNMGNQINKLESFMMMRYFSEVTSDTVTDIVWEALFRHLKQKISFEVIAVGGDDIFLIVPGKDAYDIACTIGTLFDQRFRNQSVSENKITMSLGVCITHDKMPVQYSFEIAQKLLKSAKQKAWEERKKCNITGTIDWMVIENDIAGSTVLEYQRRGANDKSNKTLRPYTWKQARAVKEFIKGIQNEKSFAFQLRQSWYQHTKKEAELFYEYQISRKKEKEKKNFCLTFEKFAKDLGGKIEINNVVYQEKVYSPWIDIVELWDYVEEE